MTTARADTATRNKTRRRWFQFSLRALLVATVVVGFGSAWTGMEIKRGLDRRKVAYAFKEAGASVQFGNSSSETRLSSWLRSLLGVAESPDVVAIGGYGANVGDVEVSHLYGQTGLLWLDLSHTEVTDEGVSHLTSLTKLEWLGLKDTEVTDDGVSHLRKLKNLDSLWLDNTQVTDKGLSHLRGLTQLQVLGLSGTQVTDAGLKHLHGMTRLESLSIGDTQISEAGVAKLKKALPNVTVQGK